MAAVVDDAVDGIVDEVVGGVVEEGAVDGGVLGGAGVVGPGGVTVSNPSSKVCGSNTGIGLAPKVIFIADCPCGKDGGRRPGVGEG